MHADADANADAEVPMPRFPNRHDILLHELKTSALITKLEPAAKAEIVIDIYRFNSLVKLY